MSDWHMKRFGFFLFSTFTINTCFAELIPVSVELADAKKIERVQGRCEPNSANLVCHLTETTIETDKPTCKVSTRQYVLTLEQQGPRTWGTWSFSPICKVSEMVTIELLPTPTPLSWPGVFKYTVRSTVESRKDAPELCSSIKDDETRVFVKSGTITPVKRKCDTVEFSVF